MSRDGCELGDIPNCYQLGKQYQSLKVSVQEYKYDALYEKLKINNEERKNISEEEQNSKIKTIELYEKSCELHKLEICMEANLNLQRCSDKTNLHKCMDKEGCQFGDISVCYALGKEYQNFNLSDDIFKNLKIENKEDSTLFQSPKERAKRIFTLTCSAGNKDACLEIRVDTPKERAKKIFKLACSAGDNESCLELKGNPRPTGSLLLLWAGVFLIGFAAFYVSHSIFKEEEEYKAQEKLTDKTVDPSRKKSQHGFVFDISRPFFKRYLSPVVSSMKNIKQIKIKYKRPLASAGLTSDMSPEDFYAFKLFLVLAFPILFMGIRTFLEESWPLKLIPLLAVAGFYFPNIWIKGRIEKRQKEVILAMPFSVDMLALSVEAGLDFIAAMAKVVEKAKPSPLNDEFEILLKEIKIGASRAEALRNMAWRMDLIQISSFCATLIAADSVGASIGPILKALSKELREKRSSDVEKAGATAATKILFPMMFFIIPSVFLIVAAPMILQFLEGNK